MEAPDFSGIFQFLPGNYIILLPDAPKFTIVAFNMARAMETFTRKEDIGRGILEAFPDNPDDAAADGVAMLTASLETVIREKRPHQMAVQKYDIPNESDTGFEVRYWLPKNIPVLDAAGNIAYIIHSVRDMTSLILAQQQNDYIRQNFEDFLNQSQSPFAVMSGRQFIFTYANPAYTQLMNGRQLVGKAVIEAIPELLGQPFIRQLEHVFDTGNTYHGIEVPATALFAGATVPATRFFNLSYTPTKDITGSITGVLADAYDVTEQVEMRAQHSFEEELRRQVEEKTRDLQIANGRLENSNQKLEQFAHITSHDLQEPLRKIQLYSSMLAEDSSLREKAKLQVSKINDSAKRMSGLINDLLEYARLSDESTLFKPTDLNSILENVLSDFEVVIRQKKAVIHVEKLEKIDAFSLQMNQLFYNLIGNALKFSKKDIQPIITVSGEKLSRDKNAFYPILIQDVTYYCISVRDNGIGFDQVYAEKIFSVFQRLNHSAEYGGYGIGLALCSRVVNNHNGVIYAESKVGEGSTFIVIMPLQQQK